MKNEEPIIKESAVFMESGEPESRTVETQKTKCPTCGANMTFDPATQSLRCPYCDTKKELDDSAKTAEINLSEALLAGEKWSSETTLFRCSNCGAKIVLESGATARNCPFCGASNVVPTTELSGVKPNGVLPFKMTVDEAVAASKKWGRRRLFAPRKFKKTMDPKNITGVYTPAFTFDSQTTTNYAGILGENYTVVVRDSKGNSHTETRIRWYPVSGVHTSSFDDLLVRAGGKLTDKQLLKIEPFDTNDGLAYRNEYLSGYVADHYDRPVEEMWDEAKNRMDEIIKQEIKSKYNADHIQYLNTQTTHSGVTYKYMLLPVYVGTCQYRQKLYNFFINGRTGKATGKVPTSPLRVIIAVLLGLAAIGGIVFLLMKG